MHARKIVDGLLGDCLSCLHAKQVEAVKAAVCGALEGGRLSLSQLARSIDSPTAMRHRIKRIDRLLGNADLGPDRKCVRLGHPAPGRIAGVESAGGCFRDFLSYKQ